jgi:hypothetical protein
MFKKLSWAEYSAIIVASLFVFVFSFRLISGHWFLDRTNFGHSYSAAFAYIILGLLVVLNAMGLWKYLVNFWLILHGKEKKY